MLSPPQHPSPPSTSLPNHHRSSRILWHLESHEFTSHAKKWGDLWVVKGGGGVVERRTKITHFAPFPRASRTETRTRRALLLPASFWNPFHIFYLSQNTKLTQKPPTPRGRIYPVFSRSFWEETWVALGWNGITLFCFPCCCCCFCSVYGLVIHTNNNMTSWFWPGSEGRRCGGGQDGRETAYSQCNKQLELCRFVVRMWDVVEGFVVKTLGSMTFRWFTFVRKTLSLNGYLFDREFF